MTRVIHTGDTHIGYRQYHSPERRGDFLDAFERVVRDAIDSDVDAVVHAGDLFHDRTPGLEDLMGTVSVLRELDDRDIPFLAVVGNHEGTRTAQWLDLLESLSLAERLDYEPRIVGDTAFYGQDFVPEANREELTYDFEAHDADCAALVAHGAFTPFAHASWETDAILDASPVDFNAVLLGDNHQPGRKTVRETPVTYCGSTERASASERDERGYNVVRFGADAESGRVRLSRRGIETRPFVFLDLELEAGEGESRVRERLREESLADAVVIVTLTGEGERVPPAEIERFGKDNGALIVRVNDRREGTEADATPSVSFADPDDAVRERVREMGLSDAARTVDSMVRGDELADSNVRGAVKEEVKDLLASEQLAAFEGVENEQTSDGEAESDNDSAEADDDSAEAVSDDEAEPTPDDDSATSSDESDSTPGDGQVTMGDYS